MHLICHGHNVWLSSCDERKHLEHDLRKRSVLGHKTTTVTPRPNLRVFSAATVGVSSSTRTNPVEAQSTPDPAVWASALKAAEQRGLEHLRITVPLAPDTFLQEARSDSFQYPPVDRHQTSLPTARDIHENKIVYMIYLLVFWLHAQCHLPFRACNAILVCLALIFKSAGIVLDPPIHSTLPSVMTALHADPIFQVCPVCPTCQKVYPPATSVESCTTQLLPQLSNAGVERHVRTPNHSCN
jgi:hypothetical protein